LNNCFSLDFSGSNWRR